MGDLTATIVDWFLLNMKWIFSGVGVVVVVSLSRILANYLKESKRKADGNQQPISIDASRSSGNVSVILHSSDILNPSRIAGENTNTKTLIKKEEEYKNLQREKEKVDSKIETLLASKNDLAHATELAKAQFSHDFSDISDWLSNNIDAISERLFNSVINHEAIDKGALFETSRDLENFKCQIKQIIELIEVSVLSGNFELLDEPNRYTQYSKKSYSIALVELNKTLPFSLSDKSKREFTKYILYLLDRIDLGS